MTSGLGSAIDAGRVRYVENSNCSLAKVVAVLLYCYGYDTPRVFPHSTHTLPLSLPLVRIANEWNLLFHFNSFWYKKERRQIGRRKIAGIARIPLVNTIPITMCATLCCGRMCCARCSFHFLSALIRIDMGILCRFFFYSVMCTFFDFILCTFVAPGDWATNDGVLAVDSHSHTAPKRTYTFRTHKYMLYICVLLLPIL